MQEGARTRGRHPDDHRRRLTRASCRRMKDERVAARARCCSGPAPGDFKGDRQALIDAVRDALYASKICSYAQGMNLMRERGRTSTKWDLNLGEVSSHMAGRVHYPRAIPGQDQASLPSDNPDLPNLLLDPDFKEWVLEAQPRWREAISTAQSLGIPVAAMSASLAYFDSYRAESLPHNLTQAQRDFFGSHTYKRIDDPERKDVHTEWE